MLLPENASMNYQSLLYKISEGIIKIPQFQRDFVWEKKKSAQLLDSILKGYPIGTFTLWDTQERLRTVRNIGNISIPDTTAGHSIQYVLDGQQRITSLYAAFKGQTITRIKGNKVEDFSEIYIDLEADENEQLVITDVENKIDNTYIKVTDLLSTPYIVIEYPEKYHLKMNNYYQRFLNFSYSSIVLKNASIDVATEAFTRLNIGGNPLSLFEIMVAKTYDENRGFDLFKKYDELAERLSEKGYSTVSGETILHVISTLIVGECSRKQILELSRDEFINMWHKAVDAIERTVDYFKSAYHIKVSKMLPYNGLIVPFSYFFYHHKGRPIEQHQRLYLQDFFWRTSLSERYSSSLVAHLSQDIKRIKAILNNEIPNYDYDIKPTAEWILENGHFSVGKALIKSILCLYASYEPLSFAGDIRVKLDNDWLKQANSKNYHHFFPKKYLEGMHEESMINHILNITIVDEFLNKGKINKKAPSVYMKEFNEINLNLKSTMETHLISLNEDGIWSDDFNKFIENRAHAVSNALQSKLINKNAVKQ